MKLRGLDYVVYNMCQCAVLLKDKTIVHNVFGRVAIVEMVKHLSDVLKPFICDSCLKKNFHS